MRLSLMAVGLLFLWALPVMAGEKETEEVLTGLQSVSTHLAYDRFKETKETAIRLVASLENWLKVSGDDHAQAANAKKMLAGVKTITETLEEKPQRESFATLSDGGTHFLKADPALQTKWQLFYCPMAKLFHYWAQPKGEKMANPFMGTEMLQCGVKKAWAALP